MEDNLSATCYCIENNNYFNKYEIDIGIQYYVKFEVLFIKFNKRT